MSLSTAANSSSTLSPHVLMVPIFHWRQFLTLTFCFDFSTEATIACSESLCLLIRVTLLLDNIVLVLLLVIQSWVSFVLRSQLATSGIFFPLKFSSCLKFYHGVPSEVLLYFLGSLQIPQQNLTVSHQFNLYRNLQKNTTKTSHSNDWVDGHCYSFAWIQQSWTFRDSYFLLMDHDFSTTFLSLAKK